MTPGARITRPELENAAAVLRSAGRHGYRPQTIADCARVADLLDQWARSMRPPKWAPDACQDGASGLGERGG